MAGLGAFLGCERLKDLPDTIPQIGDGSLCCLSQKALSRGQHREHLATAAQGHVIEISVALIDGIDLRARWTAPPSKYRAKPFA